MRSIFGGFVKNLKSIVILAGAFLGLILVGGVSANAAKTSDENGAEPKALTTPLANKKKSTEVSFDDVLVQGKYHFSDEAVTTVEDDKILDALLGVRTDFKDRIKKSTARQ